MLKGFPYGLVKPTDGPTGDKDFSVLYRGTRLVSGRLTLLSIYGHNTSKLADAHNDPEALPAGWPYAPPSHHEFGEKEAEIKGSSYG